MENELEIFYCDKILIEMKEIGVFNLVEIVNKINNEDKEIPVNYKIESFYDVNHQTLKKIESFMIHYGYIDSLHEPIYYLTKDIGVKAKKLNGHQKYQDYIEKLETTERELKDSTIQSNESATTANKWMPYLTASLVFVSIIGLIRDVYKDKMQESKEVQYQQQKKSIDSLEQTLQNLQSIENRRKDSLNISNHFKKRGLIKKD